MRRLFLTGLTVGAMAPIAWAQFPPPPMREPNVLPPSVSSPKTLETPKTNQSPTPSVGADGLPTPKPEMALTRAENAKPLGRIDVKYTNNNWQVWGGPTVFANFGTDWKSAEKTANTLQALQAGQATPLDNVSKATTADMQNTSWATVGSTRPVVGYMTARGDAVRSIKGVSNTWLPIDLTSVHAEEVRGVWVVRDGQNILLNFGDDRREAEQAVAVAKRYGFNRLGFVGGTDAPALRYFFAAADQNAMQNPLLVKGASGVTAAFQEANLDHAGIDIPGFGTVGQRINLDTKKLDIRREGADYVLAHSSDVLAKFGRDEWSARDALRIVQQMRPTAIVHVGNPGITFFMEGSEPPKRLPFGTQGAAFIPDKLSSRQSLDGVIHLYDSITSREIASVKTQKEADAVRAAIKHFNLNRTCQIGNSPATSFTFLGRVN